MLPFVYDFHWDAGHVIFLGSFFTVLAILAAALGLAFLRARRDLRDGRGDAIRWTEDFHALPSSARACRHELTGEIAHRTCPNGFDCRICDMHPKFPRASTGASRKPDLPDDRLYHRGHTWVRPGDDGSVTIGLDDLALKLLGAPERLEMPEPGRSLHVGGTGWIAVTNGLDVRVLSPVDGEVQATGGPDQGWYLKVRPVDGSFDLRHLLQGIEARAWMRREIDRLHTTIGAAAAGPGALGPTLADGGTLAPDLADRIPEESRGRVVGEMMMDL